MVQHEQKVTEKPVVKRIQTRLKKAAKFPEFVDTDPVKKVKTKGSAKQKAAKSPEFVEMDSQDSGGSYVEYIPRTMQVSLLIGP